MERDIEIVFAEGHRRYACGERLRGVVRLRRCEEGADCLVLRVGWHTAGRGSVDEEWGEEQRCAIPAAGADGLRHVAFDMIIPDGPVSFRGELVGVAWRLRASIDRARELSVDQEIVIDSQARPNALQLGGYREAPIVARARQVLGPLRHPGGRRKQRRQPGLGTAMLGIGLGSVALAVVHPAGIVAVMLAFGIEVGLLVVAIGRGIAGDPLGRPRLEIEPIEARPGDVITARAHLKRARRGSVREVRATLRCHERALSGVSGHDRETHAETQTLTPMGDGTRSFAERFVLPQDALPSFGSTHNFVEWTMTFTVDARRSDDDWPHVHEESIALVVRPS
jgi:hypothetical protein